MCFVDVLLWSRLQWNANVGTLWISLIKLIKKHSISSIKYSVLLMMMMMMIDDSVLFPEIVACGKKNETTQFLLA